MTVSEKIQQACRIFGYAGPIEVTAHVGHDVLLQAINTHSHMINQG